MSGRNARINHSNIYIKDGKKTGIVVALEGMAKAGWLVDHRGDKITNIGDSVELILENCLMIINQKCSATVVSCKNGNYSAPL